MYTLEAIEKLIAAYIDKGGLMIELIEGSLGYGTTMLYDPCGKLKTIIIQEKYLNCWSSGHKIRKYNKMPDKYRKLLELVTEEY